MVKKIYIIGPIGSGKTTLSKRISQKNNIKYYELDKVYWDDDNGNIKRSDEETIKIFNEILKNKSWIIEDVGREQFKKGREEADIIYYIKFSRIKSYFRVIKRWIKQKLGIETYNCPPTFKELIYLISNVSLYYKNEKNKLKSLKNFKDKLVFVTNRQIEKLLK